MTLGRLSSDSWISSYRQHLQLEGIPVYILKKGNSVAGSILIKVSMSGDLAKVYHNVLDAKGDSNWDVLIEGNHEEIDKSLERQISFDSDLWLLEVEEKEGKCLLDKPFLKRG